MGGWEGDIDAKFVEPSYSFGYKTQTGVAPAPSGSENGYKLLTACADDDPKHEDANLELIENQIKSRGCSPDGDRTNRFSPPLHLALGRSGLQSIIAKLLELGADVNLADRLDSKRRPLHVACAVLDIASVKKLLEHGAQPNLCDRYGRSPLHVVAAVGDSANTQLKIVELLVKAGADPDLVARNGDTPLHAAVRRAQLDTVRGLLEVGANPEPERMLLKNKRRPTSRLDEYGDLTAVETPCATTFSPAELARNLGLLKIDALLQGGDATAA